MIEQCVFVKLLLALGPTANLFGKGHRIRLDISSSNFPRLDLNPNTGEPIGKHTHTTIARNQLHVDSRHPSRIDLPVTTACADAQFAAL